MKYQLSTMLSCKAALAAFSHLSVGLVTWRLSLGFSIAVLVLVLQDQDQDQNSAKMNDDLLEMLMYLCCNAS